MHHPHTAPRSLDPHATAARSPVREVRHPNSVTAPPVHRGSMPALPWQGFWKSVARALTGRTPPPGYAPDNRCPDPVQRDNRPATAP